MLYFHKKSNISLDRKLTLCPHFLLKSRRNYHTLPYKFVNSKFKNQNTSNFRSFYLVPILGKIQKKFLRQFWFLLWIQNDQSTRNLKKNQNQLFFQKLVKIGKLPPNVIYFSLFFNLKLLQIFLQTMYVFLIWIRFRLRYSTNMCIFRPPTHQNVSFRSY